jgi:hypothetical protein
VLAAFGRCARQGEVIACGNEKTLFGRNLSQMRSECGADQSYGGVEILHY